MLGSASRGRPDARRRRPRHPGAMDGITVRLELELQFDGDSIRGVLIDAEGTAVDIVGRIGLLAAIDTLAQDHRHEERLTATNGRAPSARPRSPRSRTSKR